MRGKTAKLALEVTSDGYDWAGPMARTWDLRGLCDFIPWCLSSSGGGPFENASRPES